jgi:hypothetical protein
MIMQKVTIAHKDRNAKTVDEFYYKDMEEQLSGKKGTGVRALAGDFIRQGKALDRFLILKDNGCVLESYILFKTAEDLNEFSNHPISIGARNFFAEKGWTRTIEIYPVDDYLNVRDRLNRMASVI